MTRAAQQFVTPLSLGALSNDRSTPSCSTSTTRPRSATSASHARPTSSSWRRPPPICSPRWPAAMPTISRRRAAGDRQTGTGSAGDEPAHVAAPGDRTQRRPAPGRRRRLVGPSVGEMAGGEVGPGRLPRCRSLSRPYFWLSRLSGKTLATPRPSPAGMCSSPAARPTSRSTRCATSPTAPPASRVRRSPRRPWRWALA